MMDRDALLDAVHAAPDDDAPRLVLADWFEENGEVERAGFVRTQIAMRREYETNLRLTARLEQLFLEQRGLFHQAWASVARQCLSSAVAHYTRGFFDGSVRVTAEQFATFLPDLVPWIGPNAWVFIADCQGSHLDQAKGLPELKWVRRLGFTWPIRDQPQTSHADVSGLLKSPHLSRLTHLQLAHLNMTRRIVEELCEADNLEGLQYLNLHGNRLGTAGLLRIADNPRFGSLANLDLSDTGATTRGVIAILSSPHLRSLQKLSIGDNNLSRLDLERAVRPERLAIISFEAMSVRW